jgi:V/A-type H+-transporting ATPase subunit A
LAEADRLESVVELVGLTGLPGNERMAILAGRLLRDAVLQQNALSPNDATCGPDKQSALLDLVLAVHDACLSLIERGVPSAVIEEFDLSPVARLRDELAPNDAAGVATAQRAILAAMEQLA